MYVADVYTWPAVDGSSRYVSPTKTQCLRCSWALPNHLKHNEDKSWTTCMDLSYLLVAQMPRCPDLAILW